MPVTNGVCYFFKFKNLTKKPPFRFVSCPELVNDLAQLHIAPIDGAALTEVCHARGISMRYLGRLRTALRAAGAAPMANLCTVEMITRAASALMGYDIDLLSIFVFGRGGGCDRKCEGYQWCFDR